MIKNIVFRFIRGRLVPIISRGTHGQVKAQKAAYKKLLSTKRKTIKNFISNKTSISEKRINAIKSAKNLVLGKGKRIQNEGGSGLVNIFDLGTNIGKSSNLKKSVFQSKKEITKRFLIKNTLSKKGLAPESFLVKTSKRNILIQQKASNTLQEKSNKYLKKLIETSPKSNVYENTGFAKYVNKQWDKAEKLEKRASKYFNAFDVSTNNVGSFGRKNKIIDVGLFETKGKEFGVKYFDRKRIRKFLIRRGKNG